MKLNVGELNKRIAVITIVIVQNDNGFNVEQEIAYSNTWAKVANMSGTEVFKNGADYSKVITKFIVRYSRTKLYTTDMKIRYNGKLYNIMYANDYSESNDFVELICEVINHS